MEDKEVIGYLEKERFLSTLEVAKKMKKHWYTAKYILEHAFSKGIINRLELGNRTYWGLVK